MTPTDSLSFEITENTVKKFYYWPATTVLNEILDMTLVREEK
jgi:hypothetical protein